MTPALTSDPKVARMSRMKLLDRWLGDILLGAHAWFHRRHARRPARVQRILLIKLVAMGDLILITPLVRTLRKAWPSAEIDLLTTPRVRPIVENMPLYHQIVYQSFGLDFVFSLMRNLGVLRRRKYDIVLDLEFYYRITTLLSLLIRPKFLAGFDLQKTRSRVMDLAIPYPEHLHVADAFLQIAKALDIRELDDTLEPLTISAVDTSLARKMVNSEEYILMHIGTSERARSRRWDCQKWSHLIQELSNKWRIILIGGEQEALLLSHILLPDRNVTSLIGQLTLPQTAALMKTAKLYIGLDTGPTHLASAMGTPVVALYGPNTPLRWGPKNAHIIYKQQECSPCTRQHEGIVSSCSDNRCMQDITVEEVLAKIHELLD